MIAHGLCNSKPKNMITFRCILPNLDFQQGRQADNLTKPAGKEKLSLTGAPFLLSFLTETFKSLIRLKKFSARPLSRPSVRGQASLVLNSVKMFIPFFL